ncbi:MAG: hypothetical protein AN485_01500 [Anabaena sp. MDT14b]|nr:MAG: hypothetical protein AN485_01500 [Anabaena sp. MDT14b]
MDKLLSEVQADLAENKTAYIQSKPTEPQNNLQTIQFVHLPDTKSDVFVNNLLADVQADILAKDAAVALQKQEELTQEKIRQEKLQAKQKAALEKHAKQWLAKLDPLSSEGIPSIYRGKSYSSTHDKPKELRTDFSRIIVAKDGIFPS